MVEEGFLECFARAEAVHVGGDGGVVALLLPLLGRQVNGILILDGKVDLKQISSLAGVNFTNKCTRSFYVRIFSAAQLLFHQHLRPTLRPIFPLNSTRIFCALRSTPNFYALRCTPLEVGVNPLA